MSTPQQPELARNKRSAASADSAKAHVEAPRDGPDRGAPTGPVPPENEPGHHPEVDQDKPQRPPRLAPRPPPSRRFSFRFQWPFAAAGLPVGVTPRTAYVAVEDGELEVRFGPWHLRTPVDNIVDASLTGPYRWWKVIGPPRISFADGGVTFATTTEAGVCLEFRDPVPAALPGRLMKHGSATVTVAELDQLVEAVTAVRQSA